MLKFANFQVIEAKVARMGHGLVKDSHRHAFQYDPKPGFLYVRSRAISSRCNDNFDEFPAEEIAAAYRTFVGKPVFVNHHNANHRRARGVIVDAVLHLDTNPDGSPDTWVEVLMEVDAINFPILASKIVAGEIDRTSMGCDVAYSKCSYCGNKAVSPVEYCDHIRRHKGRRIRRRTASGDGMEDVLVREICYGLRFFENSLLVEDPADPTAFFLGVESGDDLVAAGRKTAAVVARDDRKTRTPQWDQEDEDLHPRDQGGKFTDSGNSGPTRVPDGKQDTAPTQEKAPEKAEPTTHGPTTDAPATSVPQGADPHVYEDEDGNWTPHPSTTGTGTKEDPVDTESVEDAAKALSLGLHVRLHQAAQVSTLLDRLAQMIQKAKDEGTKLDIDLCNVTVKGTNLFCVENKGIPRSLMPQLKSLPQGLDPNGRAMKELQPNASGEYDIQPYFLQHLKDLGYEAEEVMYPAAYLKATQNQLNAGKVAGITDAILGGADINKEPIFVSEDDYIVDGHHRWAASVAADWHDGDVGDVEMPIWKIKGLDIITLLDLSNKFAAEWGFKQQSVGDNNHAHIPGQATASKGCSGCGPTLDEMNAHAARKMTSRDPLKAMALEAATKIVGGKKDWSAHDVSWFLPGRKTPIAWSTRATSDAIDLLGDDGLTIRQIRDALLYDDEGQRILDLYIEKGYGDLTKAELDAAQGGKQAAYGGLWQTATGYVHRSQSCPHINGENAHPIPAEDVDEPGVVERYGVKACTTCFPSAPTKRTADLTIAWPVTDDPCTTCRGTGRVDGHRCALCDGSGMGAVERATRLEIAPEMAMAATIKVAYQYPDGRRIDAQELGEIAIRDGFLTAEQVGVLMASNKHAYTDLEKVLRSHLHSMWAKGLIDIGPFHDYEGPDDTWAAAEERSKGAPMALAASLRPREARGPLDTPITAYGLRYDPQVASQPIVAQARSWGGWDSLPVQEVPVSDLWATEAEVASSSINKVVGGSEPFREGYSAYVLIDHQGRHLIIDGNHRAAMYAGLGRATMPAHVATVSHITTRASASEPPRNPRGKPAIAPTAGLCRYGHPKRMAAAYHLLDRADALTDLKESRREKMRSIANGAIRTLTHAMATCPDCSDAPAMVAARTAVQDMPPLRGRILDPKMIDSIPPEHQDAFRKMLEMEQARASYVHDGRYFHASPTDLPNGTVLRPGGGPATDPAFYESQRALDEAMVDAPAVASHVESVRPLSVASMVRVAMADSSGVPEVDRLIEEFLDETLDERNWGEGAGTIRDLMDGTMSHGMCQVVSEQFTEFAKARGFKAYSTDTDRKEMGYRVQRGAPKGEIGWKGDEVQMGHYFEHTVVTLAPPGSWPNQAWSNGDRGDIIVDFTASQYGYKDHPKVTHGAKEAGVLEWTGDTSIDRSLWWQDGPDGEPHLQIVLDNNQGAWWYEVYRVDADLSQRLVADGGPFPSVDEAERVSRAKARAYSTEDHPVRVAAALMVRAQPSGA